MGTYDGGGESSPAFATAALRLQRRTDRGLPNSKRGSQAPALRGEGMRPAGCQNLGGTSFVTTKRPEFSPPSISLCEHHPISDLRPPAARRLASFSKQY